jgi:hypothetical protein
MQGMFSVKGTILVKFQFFLGITPVFLGCIIPSFTFGALQRNKFNRGLFTGHLLPLSA